MNEKHIRNFIIDKFFTVNGIKAVDIATKLAKDYPTTFVRVVQSLEADPRQIASRCLWETRTVDGKPQKVPAIKLYRSETGVGLKEAKDAIEAVM